jgi:prolyl-tRNA editing enzyme YbaK/EbsC (Cys-tRNA(Pro) deacylase)
MVPAPRRSSAQRARDYLASRGLEDTIVTFEGSTKTAALAAEAMHCQLGQIVKSLVFLDEAGEAVLALVAGDRRGDAEAISGQIAVTGVSLADAQAVRAATGYAIGGVSPLDLPPGLRVLVDDSLTRFDEVYTAAGTPNSMARLTVEQLIEVSSGRVARISQGGVR